MATITIPRRRGTPRAYPEFQVMNPGKGLNNLISENLIDDHEASDLLNIQFVEAGGISKRNGHTVVGTGLSNSPRGLAFFNDSIAGNRDLLTVDGTALKFLSGSSWTSVSGASFSSTAQVNFTQARGMMFVLDGTNPIAKIASGRTLTRNGHAPSAQFSIYFLGRHIAAGTAGQPNRLFISKSTDASEFTVTTGGTQPQPDNTNDADSGTANVPGASAFSSDSPGVANANVIDIAKFDGDKITGLSKSSVNASGVLMIFKERSIWQLTFDSSNNPVVTQISNSIGAVSHKSIDSVDNDVFFLSRNGYFVLGNEPNFNNAIRTNELSTRIHPVISTISAANLPRVSAIFSDYTFRAAIPSGGTNTNNQVMTYDKRYQAWSVLSNENANSYCEFIDSGNIKHLYYAADDEAQVYEIGTGYSDNSTAINSYWVSKAYDFGNFSQAKQFIDIDFFLRQLTGTITISFIADGNTTIASTSISNTSDTSHTWGADMWAEGSWGGDASTSVSTSTGTSTQNVPYRYRLNKVARSLKIKISNDNNNENFVLLGYKIYYRPYAHAKFPSALKIGSGQNISPNTLVDESGQPILT